VKQRYLASHLLPVLIALVFAAPVQQVYGAGEQPDLKRLYEVSASEHFQNPVIVIHGVFGAKIRTIKDQKEIWPGNTSSLLFSSYEKLAMDIDPATLKTRTGRTEAYALFDRVGGHDYYGKIVKTLHDAGRYEPAMIDRPQAATAHAYYVFVYDWRRGIPGNAAKLDAFIEQIRRDYNMPKLKVDIVAHSMGALLTRYFIRYGTRDVLDSETFRPDNAGADKVRKVVLIGAPNMGSVSGLQYFLTGYKLGFGSIPTEVMATMPGSYELLPHPARDWMITPEGVKADVKLYDIRIVFGGDCELTPARCLIEKVRGKVMIRLNPEKITNRVRGVNYRKLMLEPGDGRVTKPSLLARNSLDPSMPGNSRDAFPLAYSLFLCETHAELTGNISFQDNLLNILLLQETTEDRMLKLSRHGD